MAYHTYHVETNLADHAACEFEVDSIESEYREVYGILDGVVDHMQRCAEYYYNSALDKVLFAKLNGKDDEDGCIGEKTVASYSYSKKHMYVHKVDKYTVNRLVEEWNADSEKKGLHPYLPYSVEYIKQWREEHDSLHSAYAKSGLPEALKKFCMDACAIITVWNPPTWNYTLLSINKNEDDSINEMCEIFHSDYRIERYVHVTPEDERYSDGKWMEYDDGYIRKECEDRELIRMMDTARLITSRNRSTLLDVRIYKTNN